MRRKAALVAVIAGVALMAFCFHRRVFQDDEKRIREIIEDMALAAEQKNAERFIDYFSGSYSDSSNHNKFMVYQMLKRGLTSVDEFKVKIENIDVMVMGDTAYATVAVSTEALQNGKMTFPFGSPDNPETPRVTFEKTATGDWLITSVANVDMPGGGNIFY